MADDPRHGGIGRALHDLGKSVAALPGRPGRNVLSGPPAGLFACARMPDHRRAALFGTRFSLPGGPFSADVWLFFACLQLSLNQTAFDCGVSFTTLGHTHEIYGSCRKASSDYRVQGRHSNRGDRQSLEADGR